MPYMYILRCPDGRLYTGSTWDLSRRLNSLGPGLDPPENRGRRPLQLVYFEYFDRIDEAYYREREIHSWGRARKARLIVEGPGVGVSTKQAHTTLRSGWRQPPSVPP